MASIAGFYIKEKENNDMEIKMKLIPAALLVAGLFSSNAFAADCSAIAEWDSATVYTGGKQVQQGGQAYKAAWWTKGDSPENNSGGGL